MKQRKIPMRKDLLTNEMRPKKEMVRIVRLADETVAIDPTGKQSGRGAYVALDPAAVQKAKQKKLIDTAFGIKVAPEFYDELFAYVDHQKARQELFGNAQ
ncbi:RNase P modulator RnpM [Lacticaseibacillus brantae]|uniref:Nucleic-acid-binding protein implicated in transcription termination n=1 Tax=Lacticaseibacillus brantae DSM 23927 TaxID=1423727 RepID=A0A0R2B9C5_9LACO|nr:YlxR family protein [Lacticaseibacillus brantae]KRM72758.1 nucleic-acid-binding protein implicated in transcription termination [Lacticaseibacillus brantae DSM 23927]